MKSKFFENVHLRLSITSLFLILLVVLVHNIIVIFIGNREEFSIEYFTDFYMLAIAFGTIFFPVAVFLIIIRNTEKPIVLVSFILSFIALMVWINSNFNIWHLGVLNGINVVIEPRTKDLVKELVGVFLFIYIFSLIFFKNPRVILLFESFLCIFLVLHSAYLFYQDERVGRSDSVDLAEVFRFSKENNTLIILMDAFQSDVFLEIVETDPSVAEQLDGFRFLKDYASTSRTTFLTMPSLHAGDVYQRGEKLGRVYAQSVGQGSVFSELSRKGHHVTLVNPIRRVCPKDIEICVRANDAMYDYDYIAVRQSIRLLDYSLFRSVPLALKNFVYQGGAWLLSGRFSLNMHSVVSGDTFLSRLADELEVQQTGSFLKFFHLFNTHPPEVFDDQCRYKSDRQWPKRTMVLEQGRCAMNRFLGVVRSLKAAGIYDKTHIVLLADTGRMASSSYVEEDSDQSLVQSLRSWDPIGAYMVGGANPVMLIKPRGSQGPLGFLAGSGHASDFPFTLCELTKDCRWHQGKNLLKLGPSAEGNRTFYDYHWKREFWDLDELPYIRQFAISGPLWKRSSWMLLPGKYRLGERIDFGHKGSAYNFSQEGWRWHDDHGLRMNGPIARLGFELDREVSDDLTLALELTPILEESDPDPEISVEVNGQQLTVWSFSRDDSSKTWTVQIPRELAANGIINIAFLPNVFPHYVPDDLSEQTERLGIRLDSIQIMARPNSSIPMD